MERRMIYSGKITPGISKSQNCLQIINQINKLKIKKEMKEMLFLAAMKIFPTEKRNEDIIFHLESFRKNGKIYPEFSSSKYIQNIINEVKLINEDRFQEYIEQLIEYVKNNNIEFK